MNQKVGGSNPRWFTTKQGASWGCALFFRGAAEAHALDTPKCPRKGKRYIIEKGISQAAYEARRCVQGFESPMVHQQNKNTR